MSTDKDLIEISGEILYETDLAILLYDGETESWIPKSQIEIEPKFFELGDMVVVTMPEWLAEDKELI
jgi:RNase P/RNase MRP subunit p29